MKRREFIALLGGAAGAWPLAAQAQQPQQNRRVGILVSFVRTDPEGQARVGAFRQRMRELGWIEGRSVMFEERWVPGYDPGGMLHRTAAAELVRMSPDALLANGGRTVTALLQETKVIPIVFAAVTDPIGQGSVKSLARPGGNVTGFTQHEFVLGKLLEIIKEIAPNLNRVAFAFSPNLIRAPELIEDIRALASSLGVAIVELPLQNPADIVDAFKAFAAQPNGGVIVPPDTVLQVHRQTIITAAADHRLPTIFTDRVFVADGGLISYGADRVEQYQKTATYIDRILRGEKPADLPVQRPTKFHLAINLKTAKALGPTCRGMYSCVPTS